MAKKRPDGSLEHDILDALWSLGDPSTPAQILALLPTQPAYTTVATVLTRLCDKGIVERIEDGRPYKYRALTQDASMRASKMLSELAGANDSRAALAQFVSTLSRKDEKYLRQLLKDDAD